MVAGRLHSAAGALTGFCIEYVLSLFSNDSVALGADHLMGHAVLVINDLLNIGANMVAGRLLSAADAVSAALAEIHRAIVLIGVRLRRIVYALFARLTNIIVGSILIIDLILLGTTTGAVLKVRSNSECSGAQAHSHDQAQQHAYNFLHLLVLLSHLFCVFVTFAGYSRG